MRGSQPCSDYPRAQADRVDHPPPRVPAALARLAVQRSLDRHRPGQGVMRRLAASHLGVAETANDDGRHVDVQGLQNRPMRGQLDAARLLGDRLLHLAVVHRRPAPRAGHRALHPRHHRRERLPETAQLFGDLDDQLGHATSSPSGPNTAACCTRFGAICPVREPHSVKVSPGKAGGFNCEPLKAACGRGR